MSNFNQWLDTFIEEKGIETELTFTVTAKEHPIYGEVINPEISYQAVIEGIKRTFSPELKRQVKNKLVAIDFQNGNVQHFLRYIGQGMINQQRY